MFCIGVSLLLFHVTYSQPEIEQVYNSSESFVFYASSMSGDWEGAHLARKLDMSQDDPGDLFTHGIAATPGLGQMYLEDVVEEIEVPEVAELVPVENVVETKVPVVEKLKKNKNTTSELQPEDLILEINTSTEFLKDAIEEEVESVAVPEPVKSESVSSTPPVSEEEDVLAPDKEQEATLEPVDAPSDEPVEESGTESSSTPDLTQNTSVQSIFRHIAALFRIGDVFAQSEIAEPVEPVDEPLEEVVEPEVVDIVEDTVDTVEIVEPDVTEESGSLLPEVSESDEVVEILEVPVVTDESDIVETEFTLEESVQVEPVVTQRIHVKDKELILSGFSFQNPSSTLYNSEEIDDPQLVFSFASEEMPEKKLIVEYLKNDTWKKMTAISFVEPHDNAEYETFLSYSLEDIVSSIHDISELTIRLTMTGLFPNERPALLLDAVWVEATLPTYDASLDVPIELISSETDFETDEDVSLIFSYTEPIVEETGVVKKLKKKVKNVIKKKQQLTKEKIIVSVTDHEGNEVTAIDPDIVPFAEDGMFLVSIPSNQKEVIKPGAYEIEVTVYGTDDIVTYTQDFTWGVLALNTNRGLYRTGENAYIQMAALDADGHTICDAALTLDIMRPDGITQSASVLASPLCGPDNIIDEPDYFTYYPVDNVGTYNMTLRNTDNDFEITETFSVSDEEPFYLEREGPTRINPVAPYQMRLTFEVEQSFVGNIQEELPESFEIFSVVLYKGNFSEIREEVSITRNSHRAFLSADVSWNAGDVYILEYEFDAPNISPFIFPMGPAEIVGEEPEPVVIIPPDANVVTSTEKIDTPVIALAVVPEPVYEGYVGTYTESRIWHIASDAIAVVDPDGDGTVGCTATPSGTHATTIDDGTRSPTTPDIADYITCDEDVSDIYTLGTITNATSTTAVEIFAYYKNGNANMQWEVELWDAAETTQYGVTKQLATSTSNVWDSVNITGLTLTQTQLDGLRLKVTNVSLGGATTTSDMYALYASLTYTKANEDPTAGTVVLNGGSTITLTEGTTTDITTTATVTDTSGYGDIVSVQGKLYRSGVAGAEACTNNDNNCYEDTSCPLSGCSGDSCTATCVFSVQYHADPTDADTPWESEYWRTWVEVTDSLSQTGSAYSGAGSPEMASLLGLSVQSDIDYGVLNLGDIIEPANNVATVSSTGNVSLDIMLSGTDMIGAGTMDVSVQRYTLASSTSFASSTMLSATSTLVELNIPKNIVSTTMQFGSVWWGIGVPASGLSGGSYIGTTTYSAVVDTLPW